MVDLNKRPHAALALVAVIAVWRLAVLAFAPPNLSFDEAQYWAWAQTLQLGYYSKPPMVAWAIAATTALFGDGEGAIKLGSALAHTATAYLLYLLGRELFDRRIGAWAALGWATMPAVSLSSMVITTDPFLLTCWAAALLFLVRAERAGPGVNGWWVALGCAFGLGMLSKYAMAFFLAGAALWMILVPQARRLLRGGGVWTALIIGAALYAPNLIWNAANGFVSYAHTRDNANLGGQLFNVGKLLEFVGGQFGVAGPIIAAALIAALIAALRRNSDARMRFLASFTLPVLAVMTAQAFISRANANWTAPAYAAGIVLTSAYLAERAPRLLAASLALHLAAMGVLYNLDAVRSALNIESARFDPMKRIRGWDETGRVLSKMLENHPDAVLMADERKVLATLTYYVHPHPFDAVKWNPSGLIHDHFDQTTRLAPGPGPWIYATENPEPPDTMLNRFGRSEKLGDIDAHTGPGYGRPLAIWLLADFKGYVE